MRDKGETTGPLTPHFLKHKNYLYSANRIMAGIGAYVVHRGQDDEDLCTKLVRPLEIIRANNAGLNHEQLTTLLDTILTSTTSKRQALNSINTAPLPTDTAYCIEIFKLTADMHLSETHKKKRQQHECSIDG